MQTIQEVSLGFAEFVSQLIQETFEAVLSSQNYQLERYAELQGRLNLPNEAYRTAYHIDDKVGERVQQYFGFQLDRGAPVDQALNDFLVDNFDDISTFIDANNILTPVGYEAVEEFIINLIITEEKAILNTLINQSDVSKLVVDSGEITAKLELSSMFIDDQTGVDGGAATTKNLEAGKESITKGTLDKNPKITTKPKLPNLDKGDKEGPDSIKETINTGTLDPGLVNELLLPTYNRNIKVLQFQNDQTGRNTLLIDKGEFNQINSSNVLIPNVRLSAQPTKLTTNSNLYSEIKISFKTV